MTDTTSEILDRLGREKVAECLGVGLTAISNASVRGTFPASWYVGIKHLCDRKKIDCPPYLFKQRGLGFIASETKKEGAA